MKKNKSKQYGSVEGLVELANKAKDMDLDLPKDLSTNHDYYAHGLPLREPSLHDSNELIYRGEAAKILGVSGQMVDYYRKKGHLKGYQNIPRGEYRYLKSDVLALLNRRG